jgi:hypothetical protein
MNITFFYVANLSGYINIIGNFVIYIAFNKSK